MTLFIKTYKQTDYFGTKWVCQPVNLGAFDYEGGASDDSEPEAIRKCFAKYRGKYKSYFQTERNGKAY
jgi:hypothetical protein